MKMRMAQLTGKGIKKRCRKESFICIQAVGISDIEAIENFDKEIDKESLKYSKWNLKSEGVIFDVEKDHESFCFSIFPTVEKDNLVTFDYVRKVN